MNISKLKKFAWAFFALALTTTTVFSQGWRNSNRGNFSQVNVCTEQISDLTEDQKAKITVLVNEHQKAMEDLRTNRQSTADAIEKSEIRTEMLKNVKSHREAVKSLLTENQQKQYDVIHFRGNNQGNQIRNGQGRGNGRFTANNCCPCRGNRSGTRGFGQMNSRRFGKNN